MDWRTMTWSVCLRIRTVTSGLLASRPFAKWLRDGSAQPGAFIVTRTLMVCVRLPDLTLFAKTDPAIFGLDLVMQAWRVTGTAVLHCLMKVMASRRALSCVCIWTSQADFGSLTRTPPRSIESMSLARVSYM